ncbi:MAG: PhnE/PtxC family ABC transporter permease [Anaerolineales bacterium]
MSLEKTAVEEKSRISFIHAIPSAVVPGLGQFVAGRKGRGVGILATFLVLIGLVVYTIAQRPRFPDYTLSAELFGKIYLQALLLLLFVRAVRYLVIRYALEDAVRAQLISAIGDIAYLILIFVVGDQILDMAGTVEELGQIFGLTALLSAAGLALFWAWQVEDAATIQPDATPAGSRRGFLFACVVIFVLGWNITQIDLPKAVSEFSDTRIILRRIFWPWRAAFEYETVTVEAVAKIQAPCPEGATGPPIAIEIAGEPWVSVSPTCGELSTRALATGELTFGTELTITGGGFQPGAIVEIQWKNPIGNRFRPRGVGETDIQVDGNGEFTTTLYIPEVVIPVTAVGDQIHTLAIVHETGEIFTGNLSREMKLALEQMLVTIMIGLMATLFGIIFAVPVSFLAARNLMSPVITTLAAIVGGLLLFLPAVALGAVGTEWISSSFGGLEQAPLQTAALLFLLTVGLGVIGWRAGSRGMTEVSERAPGPLDDVIVAAGLALLGGAAGYLLGLGFSRLVLSIPLGAEVAAVQEMRYAIAGTLLLGGAAFLAAYRRGSESRVGIGNVIYVTTRTILNIIRSIEPLIWAIVATIWVGLGPFAGLIALTVHSVAALGKLYSESIESIEPGPIEAIRATGGDRLQTIMYAVMPQVLPPFISFTIYRWDINVRLSTIIGLVGGGGIGFLLIQWIRQYQYEAAGLAVWLIAITVSVLDFVSAEIRKRFV